MGRYAYVVTVSLCVFLVHFETTNTVMNFDMANVLEHKLHLTFY